MAKIIIEYELDGDETFDRVRSAFLVAFERYAESRSETDAGARRAAMAERIIQYSEFKFVT